MLTAPAPESPPASPEPPGGPPAGGRIAARLRRRGQTGVVNAILAAGGALLALAGIEGGVGFTLSHPGILASSDGTGGKALAHAREYYVSHERKVLQFLPDCSRYDPQVTYTLIPGHSCRVAGREYDVEYAANRAGLRDSDESLTSPGLVVIGDSHAMGWGVQSEESFPHRLQQLLGRTVLNAAMSSFGTVRELLMLERLALPGATPLVIQYADNDFTETRTYAENGSLSILPEWQYRAVVEQHRLATRYYPFKLVVSGLGGLATPDDKPVTRPPTDAEEARSFLDVLRRHQATVQGRTVVVVEINAYNRNDGRFVGAVHELFAEGRYPSLAPWVTVIDVSGALAPSDYYLLDGHMRASGHAKVAHLVADEVSRREARAP